MNKIGISAGIKLRGNVNRILEMVEGGAGDNAIVGHFKDEGVNISVQLVRCIRTEVEEFTKKAIPKKTTKKAIETIQIDRNGSMNTSGYPA
jgi:hypothetical protein